MIRRMRHAISVVAVLGIVGCAATPYGADGTGQQMPSPAPPSDGGGSDGGDAGTDAASPASFSLSVAGKKGSPSRNMTAAVAGTSTRRADLRFTLPGGPEQWTITAFTTKAGSGCGQVGTPEPQQGLWMIQDGAMFGYVAAPATGACGLVITADNGNHIAGSYVGTMQGESATLMPLDVSFTFDFPVTR